MTEKNRQKNLRQKKTWPIPVLPLRILIYCLLILFAVLALFQVATSKFHTVFGVIFYVLAAVFMALTAYCLIWDIRNLRRNVNGIVIPGIQKNRFANKVTHDSSYRFWISTEIALALNLVFGIFNGGIGLMSHSAWCVTMAFYYMILGGCGLGQFGIIIIF